MSTICSRCRGVFYSNADYIKHKCAVELVPRDAAVGKAQAAHVDIAASVGTKGLPIQERLAKLLPDDTTGNIHDSMTVFQSLAMHLADKASKDQKTTLQQVDIRCLVRGLHAMCDRIEKGGGT